MGRADVVEFLIAKGADINARETNGMTPLKLTVSQWQWGIADILRKAGGKE